MILIPDAPDYSASEITPSPISTEDVFAAIDAAINLYPPRESGWVTSAEYAAARGVSIPKAETALRRAALAGKLRRQRAICEDGVRWVYRAVGP